MRLALICTEMLPVPPLRGGAIQQYLWGIGPLLAKRHDVTVFSRDDSELPQSEFLEGVEFLRVPSRNRRHYLEGVTNLLKERTYDLVHVFNRPEWVLRLADVAPRSRLVMSLHNEMMAPSKISFEHGLRCLDALDAVNTISRYVAARLVARFPQVAPKVRTIYSGVDVNSFKPWWVQDGFGAREKTQAALGLSGRKVILYSNRLSAKKGGHILLEAVAHLAREYRDIGLLMLGSKWYGKNESDEYVERIQAMAQESPVPVVLTGFVKPDEIHSYYTASDVFVCCSQWSEPLSRTHYEAMAAGLPIVTTARGGNAEVVRGYGCGIVLDDYNSVMAWVQALRYLLGSPRVMREMGETGRDLALERYSWQCVASNVLDLYDETMALPRASTSCQEGDSKNGEGLLHQGV